MGDAIRWETPVTGAGGAKGALASRGAVWTARTVRDDRSVRVVCAVGDDFGRRWSDVGTIVAAEPGADLGDGCLLENGRREWWYAFRDHRLGTGTPRFSIRVARSLDAGRTWEPHSTVATSSGARRGLWSPSLWRIPDGRILCLHDDEDTPFAGGFPGHQWLVAREWKPAEGKWSEPAVASRAHDPKHLSRDGMGSLVAFDNRRFMATLESVSTDPTHASVVRLVTSNDGGRTWSWSREERGIVHAALRPGHSAYAPWTTRLPDGSLACVFTSNEAQPVPDAPATPAHRLHGDVMVRISSNRGASWGETTLAYRGGGRNYMPQLISLGKGRVALLLLDFALDTFVCVPGRME